MKAARVFIIGEIVCFIGLALSYMGEILMAFVVQSGDTDLFQKGMLLFCMLIGPLAVCNLVTAIVMRRRLSEPAVRQTFWRYVVMMKLIAIPMFALNFFFGLLYGVVAILLIVTAPVTILLALTAWFAMLSSSGYCIALILNARKQGVIRTGTAVWQVICQFIYVIDVISLLAVRKTMQKCETVQ